ncbi:MAG: DUF2017 family protein [Acidimicrobiia bacterium]|nr:DUF2017 family protein [Acidimicrobiia bacterium]
MTVERRPDGLRLEMPDWMVGFLSDIPELLATVGTVDADPAADRLAVPVYLDDAEANEDWWRWMGGELAESKAADRSAFTEILAGAEAGIDISQLEAYAMLRVLTETRLVIAARAGLEIEADYETLDEHTLAVLNTLALVQESLIEALGS